MVLVYLDHVARYIEYTNHIIVWTAEKIGVATAAFATLIS